MRAFRHKKQSLACIKVARNIKRVLLAKSVLKFVTFYLVSLFIKTWSNSFALVFVSLNHRLSFGKASCILAQQRCIASVVKRGLHKDKI